MKIKIRLNEREICAKGVAWAKRNYKKWPSAYASMGASRYCKDSNYGKSKKKKKKRANEEVRDTYGDEVVQRSKKSRERGSRELLKKEGELKKWREEQWVQADGTPCGDKKAQKNPKRCKPRAKWATMSKTEKKADQAKKKAGGKKGKQFVPATKKGKVTKGFTKKREGIEMDEKQLMQIIGEEIKIAMQEKKKKKKKKKKPCKPSKGKRFAKRVNGKCRSFGQAGKAKGGGDRIRPGTKKGDAYCARSLKIKKCKNPPCANTLSRKKWKCRGAKSVAE
jgi:hypothetical protein